MSTVKFSDIARLKEIQSRILLLTNQQLTQQEILEYALAIIDENIDLLIEKIAPGSKVFTPEEIANIRLKASHWGETTKDLSSSVDKTLYG